MAGIKDKIYRLLPLFAQNLAISVFGFFWKNRRFGGVFEIEMSRFEEREHFNEEQWKIYQTSQLHSILKWANETVPFYKDSFNKAGLTLVDLDEITIDTIDKIPFLIKNDLRKYCKSTLVSEKPEKGGEFFATSGSTGTPSNILYSPAMHQRWSAAFETRGRRWAGVSRFDSRGMIGGRRVVPDGNSVGPYYRYNIFEKQVYFSAYHIRKETAKQYADVINKYKLDYMTGYAMSNYFLAKHFRDNQIPVNPLKAVITSSEKLTKEMRELFSEVYKCKTFDSYGSVEACSLITECEHGKLHISPDVGIVEVLNENNEPCKLGESGEIVATGFLNYDQPLIRYRIGDCITLSLDQNCICGRKLPVVSEISGRLEDTVIGPDGRQMVRFHGIFVNIPEIVEGQIIQHELIRFEVKLVLSANLQKAHKDLIISRMKSQLGNVDVNINLVDSIPRTANGKFKSVISLMK